MNNLHVCKSDLKLKLLIVKHNYIILYQNYNLQVLKDENGRLYKLLGERDEEMRILRKARDEEKRALAGENILVSTNTAKSPVTCKSGLLNRQIFSRKNFLSFQRHVSKAICYLFTSFSVFARPSWLEKISVCSLHCLISNTTIGED